MTYLLLNLVIVVVIIIVFRIQLRQPSRRLVLTLACLIALTAIFDSLLIYFDIVKYADATYLGWYFGLAPIEDYFYPVVAVMIIPLLWTRIGKRHGSR